MDWSKNDVKSVLISKEELEKRVSELGQEITRDYKGKNPIIVCILKGSTIFYADLVRHIDLDIRFDFMTVSSYGNASVSSGSIVIVQDLSVDIEGKDVIIVEDIIDSGRTLYNLKSLLSERKPSSLKICTLLNKKDRREVDIVGDYVGFEIPDAFVIGYGLDYAQKYRNIPEICIIKPEAIKD